MIDGIIAEPIFIEEVENQPGFITFKVEEKEENGKKYNSLKPYEEDGLFFNEYEWIEHIISQERSYPIEIDMKRINKKNEEFMKKLKEKYGDRFSKK